MKTAIMPLNFLKCGTGSFYHAALSISVIDIMLTTTLLILLILGTSVMVAFHFFVGNPRNATKVLNDITNDVFGSADENHYTADLEAYQKNMAKDMGVFLIITFLSILDFLISCIFFDGVKGRILERCQVWFTIRLIIVVIFVIIVLVNIIHGVALIRCIPDVMVTIYRVIGLVVGYSFLKELKDLKALEKCHHCGVHLTSSQCSSKRSSVINLSGRRKEIEKTFRISASPPVVMITGPPDEEGAVGPVSIFGFGGGSSFPYQPTLASSVATPTPISIASVAEARRKSSSPQAAGHGLDDLPSGVTPFSRECIV